MFPKSPGTGENSWNKTKRRIIVFLLFFLCSVGVVAAFSGISSGQRVLEPPRAAIPANLFGMHIHHVVVKSRRTGKKTPWPPVPFAGWRLWDAHVTWGNLEEKKGEWSFETLDEYLELADEHQVELVMVLGLSPRWASARRREESKYYPGAAAEPKNIEDWRNFVRTVAERYKGRLHYYELWNEPNLEGFYSGTVDKMLELSREAYRILKEVDPSIVVVSPSAAHSGGNGIPWLEEYLSKGGGAYADIIGYHFYVKPAPPEAMVATIRQVQDLMVKYGVGDKPLWNTEAGWQKPKPFPSEELAAAYVGRSYILNWAAGVPRFYWYDWEHNPIFSLHMTEEDNTTLKPAAIAYEEVQKWLIGARMTKCETNSSNTWICQLTREGGYKARIVWNPEQQLPFKVPKRWGVRQIRNLAGDRSNLTGDRLEIGPSPLLLEKLA